MPAHGVMKFNWQLRSALRNPISRAIKGKLELLCARLQNRRAKIYERCCVRNSKLGMNSVLYPDVTFQNSKLGDYSYVQRHSIILNTEIGRFCSVAAHVKCGLGIHPVEEFVSTHPIFYSVLGQAGEVWADRSYFSEFRPVRIGNDVLIGANVTILDGVSIADGAIVAAGAVVAADVPHYAVVGGIPATIIKFRFSENTRRQLLSAAWWNRDIEWIKANWRAFHSAGHFLKMLEATAVVPQKDAEPRSLPPASIASKIIPRGNHGATPLQSGA